MKIGYACLTVGVPETNFRSCTLKKANRNTLLNIIEYNLNSLENIIDYNIKNNIRLFRISSDLIPFGSSIVNDIPWWDVFSSKLSSIGEKIKNSGMRVSMHPGQYTVLNSPKEDVVRRAIEDLNYHERVLDSLGVGIDSKIILHIGGVYNNKEKAIKDFIDNFQLLDRKINNLELEWSKYKYTILEHSHANYNKIRELLKNKDEYPIIKFYSLIEEALEKEYSIGGTVNAVLHVWGYFKSNATEIEKKKFIKYLEGYEKGSNSKKLLKNFLWKMALKYEEDYLLNSYYFYL